MGYVVHDEGAGQDLNSKGPYVGVDPAAGAPGLHSYRPDDATDS
jgi:hypothetical protein